MRTFRVKNNVRWFVFSTIGGTLLAFAGLYLFGLFMNWYQSLPFEKLLSVLVAVLSVISLYLTILMPFAIRLRRGPKVRQIIIEVNKDTEEEETAIQPKLSSHRCYRKEARS